MANTVPTICTGEPRTLKTYRALAAEIFPGALRMLDARIALYGEDEMVIFDDRRMLTLLWEIEFEGGVDEGAQVFTASEEGIES